MAQRRKKVPTHSKGLSRYFTIELTSNVHDIIIIAHTHKQKTFSNPDFRIFSPTHFFFEQNQFLFNSKIA